MPRTTRRGVARRGMVAVSAALAVVVAMPTAAHAHHRGVLRTLTTNWVEPRYQVQAPANATSVRIRVVTPNAQSSFTFHADSLQLSRCPAGCRVDF